MAGDAKSILSRPRGTSIVCDSAPDSRAAGGSQTLAVSIDIPLAAFYPPACFFPFFFYCERNKHFVFTGRDSAVTGDAISFCRWEKKIEWRRLCENCFLTSRGCT